MRSNGEFLVCYNKGTDHKMLTPCDIKKNGNLSGLQL